MAEQAFDAEAYVDAAAALIRLPLDPAHRPGVVLNLEPKRSSLGRVGRR